MLIDISLAPSPGKFLNEDVWPRQARIRKCVIFEYRLQTLWPNSTFGFFSFINFRPSALRKLGSHNPRSSLPSCDSVFLLSVSEAVWEGDKPNPADVWAVHIRGH